MRCTTWTPVWKRTGVSTGLKASQLWGVNTPLEVTIGIRVPALNVQFIVLATELVKENLDNYPNKKQKSHDGTGNCLKWNTDLHSARAMDDLNSKS